LPLFCYLAIIAAFLAGVLGCSRAVTVFTENRPLPRQQCVIIDAGHGGEDGGTTSCTGVRESQFNLEISLRLRDLLHLLGYDTRMIREANHSVYTEGDTIAERKFSDLKNRVNTANETEEGILLSIHQNMFPDSRYSGAQVFYADTENSRKLAEQMQSAFISHLNPGSRRQCKQAEGIYLMEHIQCTGILIECGFLSNPSEEARLRTADYQKQLCCVIVTALDEYLSNT
jgi:N-acetylmuramoyl-L-alanine amidase